MKTPPYSQEAEESVIGACLMDSSAFRRVEGVLTSEDFHIERLARTFAAMGEQTSAGQPIDVVTISERLKSHRQLSAVGGVSYLYELAENVVTSANIEHYAKIIRDNRVLRDLINVATNVANEACERHGDISDFLDSAGTRVQAVTSSNAGDDPESLASIVMDTIEAIEAARNAGGSGYRTGIRDLDRLLKFRDTELVVVAGRPSMGKTAFALDVLDCLEGQGQRCAIFSMEMSREELTTRLLSKESGIPFTDLQDGRIGPESEKKLAIAAGRLAEKKIVIDDTPSLSISALRAKCRKLAQRSAGGLGFVVVDYLQLMSGDARAGNREQEIASISRGLKALAKELRIPVLALSQLNRDLEKRADKRPLMSDLRESGAIEQDANAVVFMYRDDYYNPDSFTPGMTEFIVGKNRNGPTGIARSEFNKKTMQFGDTNGFDPATY